MKVSSGLHGTASASVEPAIGIRLLRHQKRLFRKILKKRRICADTP
jgi:uncharacterized membrane protein